MKKILALSSAVATYLTIAPPAFALVTTGVTLCPKSDSNGFFNLCGLEISNLVGPLVNFIFILAIIAALIYLVWGGFKWLISGGDKTALQTARDHIVAAIIGLVIIFLSYFILNFILVFFLGSNFGINNFTIPHL